MVFGVEAGDEEERSCFTPENVHVVFGRVLVGSIRCAEMLFDLLLCTYSFEAAVDVLCGIVMSDRGR